MRKTDARTVHSSVSLSIANDGSEPQFCKSVNNSYLWTKPLSEGIHFLNWNELNILRPKLSDFG